MITHIMSLTSVKKQMNCVVLGLCFLTPLSTIFFSYIVVVSFIGGRNRSARRKPL